MSTIDWLSGISGNWNTAADWDGPVPGAGDVAVVGAAGTYAVSLTTAHAVDTLMLEAPGATLSESASGSLTVTNQVDLVAGTLALKGANTFNRLSQTGGVLQLYADGLGADSVSGELDLTNGEVTAMNSQHVTNYLYLGGASSASMTFDAATGAKADFGGSGYLLDEVGFTAFHFGSQKRAGTVLWYGQDGLTTGGVSFTYSVSVDGGVLKAADAYLGANLLASATSTTVAAGATLDIAGHDTQLTYLLGAGKVVDSGAEAVLKTHGYFDGVISGPIDLELTTYTELSNKSTVHSTTVDPGATLKLLGHGLVSGNIEVDGTLAVADQAPVTLGKLYGAGEVVIQEAKGVTLAHDSPFDGLFQIEGLAYISGATDLGLASVTIDNGELAATASVTTTNAMTFKDNATLAASKGATLTVDGESPYLDGVGLTFDASAAPLLVTIGDKAHAGTVVLESQAVQIDNTQGLYLLVAAGTLKGADDTLGLVAAAATSVAIDSGATLDVAGQVVTLNSLVGRGVLTNSGPAVGVNLAGGGTFAGSITGAFTDVNIYGDVVLTKAPTFAGGFQIVGGRLTLGAVAAAETVAFVGGGGKLALGAGSRFTGAITGFAATDTITLGNIDTSLGVTAGYNAATGVFSVSDNGGHKDLLKLGAGYGAGTFSVTADPSGGVDIAWSPPMATASPQRLAAAMAGFGARAAGVPSPGGDVTAARPLLSTPR